VVRQLGAVGIGADVAEVETSALVTASLLAERGTRDAFVVGEQGLVEALNARGISVLDGEPDRAEAVVVGWDREATYATLRTASLLVERGATLVATNADASFPGPDGRWPGAGALLAAIETTTGVRAEVVGKPNAPLLRAALERAGGGKPLLIGDRLDTDITGAVRLGWDSLLVLTGVATRTDLDGASVAATYVGDDLSVLFAAAARSRPDRSSSTGMLPPSNGSADDPNPKESDMSTLDDVRKTIEATLENLTPVKAQQLAKNLADPGSAKDQVAKLATELLEWSQRNRERLREFVGREIASQLASIGVATRSDVDGLKKRVRELERWAGTTASRRAAATQKPAAKKTSARKPAAKRPATTGGA
jgi:HAD superfamily hydrolase (TIGR01450 family)